jgi:hypothetical protein
MFAVFNKLILLLHVTYYKAERKNPIPVIASEAKQSRTVCNGHWIASDYRPRNDVVADI